MVEKVLKEAGFNSKEARIYIFLVKFGQQPASIVSQRTKINRTTTYQVLQGLVKKGLVSKSHKGVITYFGALPPDQLLEYLETEKIENARRIEKSKQVISEIIPELQALQGADSTKPKVSFFEGEKGIRQAYENTLSSSEEILSYSNFEEMHDCLPHFLPGYYIKRNAKDIQVKCISPESRKSLKRYANRKAEGRDVMLVPPDKYTFTPEICIYDNTVLIVSWKEKMAIHIESQEIADLMKMIHGTSWKFFKNLKSS